MHACSGRTVLQPRSVPGGRKSNGELSPRRHASGLLALLPVVRSVGLVQHPHGHRPCPYRTQFLRPIPLRANACAGCRARSVDRHDQLGRVQLRRQRAAVAGQAAAAAACRGDGLPRGARRHRPAACARRCRRPPAAFPLGGARVQLYQQRRSWRYNVVRCISKRLEHTFFRMVLCV